MPSGWRSSSAPADRSAARCAYHCPVHPLTSLHLRVTTGPSGKRAIRPFSRLPGVRQVERELRRRRTFTAGEVVVVAVSGGADSVFLTLALHALAPRLGITLHVAHLNHGWRGAAAEADAAFVGALAKRLGLAFHAHAVLARQVAQTEKRSPEEAARRLRYAYLRDIARDVGSAAVAVGHTQDDQLETTLLALLRGSGPAGLAAMDWEGALPAPKAAGLRVVRPLLGLGREEVREALRAAGESWREDETNADPHLLRNRVRLELVPLLESLAPGARAAILRAAALSREADDFLDRQADGAARRLFSPFAARPAADPAASAEPTRGSEALAANRKSFLDLDPALQPRLLHAVVARLQGDAQGLESAHIRGALETIARGRGGAVAFLTPHVSLRLTRGQIVIERGATPEVGPPTLTH